MSDSESEWFVLDIPRPPSVNRFLNKLGNRSPCVVKWRAQADGWLRAAGRYPRIVGPYEMMVTFPLFRFGVFDAENCIKALSDWLQSREVVKNDRHAARMELNWGVAPQGCRVQIRPYREWTL